ncbi:unnamed protein product [Blepharisma stoltei]|uniref:Uncharacterized protein n=1 Tax=Blepharisma stoltei TaxID=1481888 RepID=A0AAU9J4K4_9CILI|nr:unnamed protein product [Blepharisma stoltei]
MDSPPPISNSPLPNEVQTPSPKRSILKNLSTTGDISFVKENASPRREKATKGREMWNATKSRKDLEAKVKTLQNRINHLRLQKERSLKHIEICKQRHEAEAKSKSEWEQEVKALQTKKMEKLIEQEEKKKLVHEKIRKQKELIKEAKEKLLQKNKANSSAAKRESREFEEMKKKQEEEEQEKVQERARSAVKEKRAHHHRKSTNSLLFLKSKEAEFHQRIELEACLSGEAKQKIDELEQLEANLIDELRETKLLEELELSKTPGLSFFSPRSSKTSRDN